MINSLNKHKRSMKHITSFYEFMNEAKKSYQDIARELVEIAAYYTDVDLSSDMTNAMKCDDRLDVIAFYRELKDMMKDEEPAKYKEFDKEATSFLMKYSIQESVNEEMENYMFFGNLETVKRHAEMLLALNPAEVDTILKDGHNWAADHISTCKDDIEEVCNFFQNETKEAGTGVIPYESSTNEAEMTISGLVYHQWNDKQAQRKLNKVKIKIVSDLENVLTISGEEKELDKVRDIFAIKESVINEAASVPSNIMDFAKRQGSSATALVKKAATWAEKAGKRISGGTAIGKNYSTIILDMKHQGAEIRINLDNETIKLFDEEVTDAKSFKKVLDSNSANESSSTNEAMVQIAGKAKPSGAKVLATVIADYMEENKMLDTNFVSAAHGGKNKNFLVDALTDFIMNNTF